MKKRKNEYIIEVAPLVNLPVGRTQSYSYLYSENLTAGTLVAIPLFSRNVSGIVLGGKPDFPRLGNIELKNILEIKEKNFLTEKQLTLAKWLSDYYLVSLGITLKLFVPEKVKARKSYVFPEKIPQKNIILTPEQNSAVKNIIGNQEKTFLLWGPSGSGKTEVYINTIKKIREKDKNAQFLVLIPTLTLAPGALNRYREIFADNEIARLSSDTSKGERYANWEKIRLGEAKLILGSRLALFSPFKNLKLVIIDEEQNIAYKQWDMHPKYDARETAEKLAELHKSKLVFGSATPRVSTVYSAENKKHGLLRLSPLPLAPKVNWEIVDMKKERWQKNYSLVSKTLQGELRYILDKKLQAILFINRQGMSHFSVCQNCKAVLKCPQCERALIYDEKGYYYCAHCFYKTSITPKCEKCQSLNFRNIGWGTQKIEEEIRDLFPGARLSRADAQTFKAKNAKEKIYRDFASGEIDILIGTQSISEGWDLPRVALVGIMDADNLLTSPDFLTYEKAFQHIVQTAGRTGRPNAKYPGKVILQTFDPNLPLFLAIRDQNFEEFYQKELAQRKILNYPPFSRLIRLVGESINVKLLEAEAKKVEEEFSKTNLKVSQPQFALVPKIRTKWRMHLVIKLPLDKKKENLAEIKKIIPRLPKNWRFDVDPINIL